MNKLKISEQCKYKPSRDELWTISCLAVQLRDRLFPKVYCFINAYKDCPAPALIEALKSIAKHEPEFPWPYGMKILDIESAKFYAGKNTEEHERLKKEEAQGMKGFKNILKEILATDEHG